MENGQYKITVKARDQVLNTREAHFYLNLNYQNYAVQKNDSLVSPTPKPEPKDTTTRSVTPSATPKPSATPTNQPKPKELIPDNTQEDVKETVQKSGLISRIIYGIKQFVNSLKK